MDFRLCDELEVKEKRVPEFKGRCGVGLQGFGTTFGPLISDEDIKPRLSLTKSPRVPLEDMLRDQTCLRTVSGGKGKAQTIFNRAGTLRT